MFRRIRVWMQLRGSPDPFPERAVLEAKLGYHFRDATLLRQALKHRSFLGTSGEARHAANERMEFLGDAVLDLIVSDYIYRRDNFASEGRLTQIKCAVVSGKMLAKIASELGLGEFIFMSEGESRAGGRNRESILEDAFEAVIGAIYLDGGLEAARRMLEQVVLTKLDRGAELEPYVNHKSELLEWMQELGQTSPRYAVLQEEGPEHNKLFHIAVEIAGRQIAFGDGHSKKQAEQCAARHAIEALRNNPALLCSSRADSAGAATAG